MKTLALFLCTVLCLSGTIIKAQDCKVLLKSIAGKYAGDCVKGKAEGTGQAEGTDKYSGEFKAGIPEGKGVYTWANGDVYDGMWAKGVRKGKGVLTKKDGSVTNGFWEKDKHIGAYEKPFIVYQLSNSITKNDIKKDKDNKVENLIRLNISNATGGAVSLGGGVFPRPELTDVQVLKGSFEQIVDGLETQSSIKKTLAKIIFPFRAKITVDGQSMDFEILDPGVWTIDIEIQANLRQGKPN